MIKQEPLAAPPSGAIYGHIGRRLRELRMQRELTQAQVARIISVSPQQYQKYEEAHSKISLPNLLTLTAHYGLALGAVLPEEPAGPLGEAPAQGSMAAMARDADLLARLVSAFVRIEDDAGKLRLVQLIETMAASVAGSDAAED